ncbi:helix-turn-helix transcriptional regulator [Pseudomonas sp. ABC1]|uniref:AraC family transcriptional regulator n=1 Tax=Pseudomonas sp. ABC1 TaxID=2748080 RepID=UPI0015C3279B|nr:AraC family transcriptional regulator [Pseudomonas sp. ABC1]QLF94066.1 helix-turn-helix transcriptional regulator [Pseudomonas sp. ABC1]
MRPGLSFHFGCEAESEDSTQDGLVDDHLRLVMVLEGALDVAYGDSRVRLEAPTGCAKRSCLSNAAMVAMSEPEAFRRVVRKGNVSRRISIGLDRQWLEQSLYGDGRVCLEDSERFTLHHLSTACWSASSHARAIAEQMLNPPQLLPQLLGMYLESRAIELIIEAWSHHGMAGERAPIRPALRPAIQRRMDELKAWLREHTAQSLTIDQLARQLNTTPATLQRHFRLAHGISVFEFLQQERLQQARHALEQEGVSVSQAAAIAGYANPANFSTAFKRCYGLSPKQVRVRF